MRLLSALVFLLVFHVGIGAVEPLENKSEILVYSDGLIEPVIKELGAIMGEEFKKRKIKLSTKKDKKGTIANALESCERFILKKEPALVILSLGITDVVDLKKEQLLPEVDLTTTMKNLDALMMKIQTAGIQVVLCTPGLYGEFDDQHQEINAKLDELSDMIRQLAKERSADCCDLRAEAKALLEKMRGEGKYKKKRPYLTKDPEDWSKVGAKLIAPYMKRFSGVVQSGIGRKIKEDDYITFMVQFDYDIKTAILKMEQEVQAPFGDQPKKPRLKPVRVIGKYYSGEAPVNEILNQKPTVAVVQAGMTIATHSTITFDKFIVGCDQLMETLLKLKSDVFVMTPPMPAVKGTKTVDRTSLEYTKSKQTAEFIRKSAEKHGIPVIDMFAITDEYSKANNNEFIYGRAANGGTEFSETYRMLLIKELRKVVGLPIAE